MWWGHAGERRNSGLTTAMTVSSENCIKILQCNPTETHAQRMKKHLFLKARILAKPRATLVVPSPREAPKQNLQPGQWTASAVRWTDSTQSPAAGLPDRVSPPALSSSPPRLSLVHQPPSAISQESSLVPWPRRCLSPARDAAAPGALTVGPRGCPPRPPRRLTTPRL